MEMYARHLSELRQLSVSKLHRRASDLMLPQSPSAIHLLKGELLMMCVQARDYTCWV